MKRVVVAVAFLAVLIGMGLTYRALAPGAAQSQTAEVPKQPPATPVAVATAQRETVPVRLEAIGTAQAIASIQVKSRIDAQIARVAIQDGQYVKAGDVVLELDARAAKAQVDQMDAQLARDQAQLANAKRDVQRYAPLVAKDFVSHQQYDTAATTELALEASVKSDQAALENAKVLLTYYTITAPIDGRASVVNFKAGNDVKANDVPILTINQVRPIYVLFSVAESELPSIRQAMAAGPVKVLARPSGDTGPPIEGDLAFFENAIDSATGTIALRAVFANAEDRLWPGRFVSVAVTLRDEPNMVTVPQAAVQIGQNGSYLFVVKSDNTAEVRPVSVARNVDGKAVVTNGLEGGEQVVIDGQLRLSNGSRVEIHSATDGGKPDRAS